MASATVLQLVAVGLADAVLTGDPLVTFWRFVHNPYTNFALDVQRQDFNQGVAAFGSAPKCNIDRVGDLAYWMYFVADLPGIGLPYLPNNTLGTVAAATEILSATSVVPATAPANQSLEPYWTRDVGHAMLESVGFQIGGQTIDWIQCEFLFIWEELSGQPGKRLVEMTGNYVTERALQIASRQPRRLYVPLPFWFTQNSGMVLPLASLQYHSVQVCPVIRRWQDLVKMPWYTLNTLITPGGVQGYAVNQIQSRPQMSWAGGSTTAVQPVSALGGVPVLAAQIQLCTVFLDQRERSQFADGAFEQVITEHQFNAASVSLTVQGTNTYGTNTGFNHNITFNHPVLELYWVGRLGICGTYQANNIPEFNSWFNFGGPLDNITGVPIDPFLNVQLKLNNSDRFTVTEGRYFRLVEPYQYHTNIPKEFVYSYSFSLRPEDVQPSGSCNFSRIDTIQLVGSLDGRCFTGPRPALDPVNPAAPSGTDPTQNSRVDVLIFCTNYNVVRYKFGLGGKRFSS